VYKINFTEIQSGFLEKKISKKQAERQGKYCKVANPWMESNRRMGM
jgi:hypothetical protein